MADAVAVGDRHVRVEFHMNVDKVFEAGFSDEEFLDIADVGVRG